MMTNQLAGKRVQEGSVIDAEDASEYRCATCGREEHRVTVSRCSVCKVQVCQACWETRHFEWIHDRFVHRVTVIMPLQNEDGRSGVNAKCNHCDRSWSLVLDIRDRMEVLQAVSREAQRTRCPDGSLHVPVIALPSGSPV